MPATLPKSSGGRFNLQERLNIPATRLQQEMAWVGQTENISAPVANAITATLWLFEVDAFREQEEKFMLAGEYETGLADHRVMLSQIIASGEQVVFAAQKNGMIATPAGFGLEDLQATLNSLYTTFRGEHGPKNPLKTSELIEQLLNA
jgi:hypothetical protein